MEPASSVRIFDQFIFHFDTEMTRNENLDESTELFIQNLGNKQWRAENRRIIEDLKGKITQAKEKREINTEKAKELINFLEKEPIPSTEIALLGLLSGASPINFESVEQYYAKTFQGGKSAKVERQRADFFSPYFALNTLHQVFASFEANSGYAKIPTAENAIMGVNGSYYLRDARGVKRGVFKPEKEEHGMPGNKPGEVLCKGIEPGGQAKREKVAYLLAQTIGLRVPPTFYIELGGQIGSFQFFVENIGNITQVFSQSEKLFDVNKLSIKDVQLIAYFDAVFGNTDRHNGNLLVSETLEPIDHGLILSASLEDPLKLDYLVLQFPQLDSSIDDDVQKVILDPPTSAWDNIMRENGIPEEAIKFTLRKAKFFAMAAQAKEPALTIKDIVFLIAYENVNLSVADSKTREEYIIFIRKMKSYVLDVKKQKILKLLKTRGFEFPSVKKEIAYPGDVSSMREDFIDQLFMQIVEPTGFI